MSEDNINPFVTDEQVQDLSTRPIAQVDPNFISNIKDALCTTCGNKITIFKNEISKKEHAISGMCQACQDSVFG